MKRLTYSTLALVVVTSSACGSAPPSDGPDPNVDGGPMSTGDGGERDSGAIGASCARASECGPTEVCDIRAGACRAARTARAYPVRMAS